MGLHAAHFDRDASTGVERRPRGRALSQFEPRRDGERISSRRDCLDARRGAARRVGPPASAGNETPDEFDRVRVRQRYGNCLDKRLEISFCLIQF